MRHSATMSRWSWSHYRRPGLSYDSDWRIYSFMWGESVTLPWKISYLTAWCHSSVDSCRVDSHFSDFELTTIIYVIEVWTRRMLFCRQHFQIYFLQNISLTSLIYIYIYTLYIGVDRYRWIHHWDQSICVYIINSLWPSDAIWRKRSRSTLAQVMACCLTAPSHYLNQRWLIVSKVQWHSPEGNFTRDASTINH